VDLYLIVQCRPRRARTVLACPVLMPTSLGTVAVRTVVGGAAVVVGAGGADVVGAVVDAVAAVGVAAWLGSESSPTTSSSAPMLAATTQNPLRCHSGLGFGGPHCGGRPGCDGGGGVDPCAGWVGRLADGAWLGCCPQPWGLAHWSGKASLTFRGIWSRHYRRPGRPDRYARAQCSLLGCSAWAPSDWDWMVKVSLALPSDSLAGDLSNGGDQLSLVSTHGRATSHRWVGTTLATQSLASGRTA